MNKQTIITALLTLAVLAVYGQTDSTMVKKKKEDWISMYGSVADGFTKAIIPDVKVILMHEDSTVIDTTTVWESHSWSSGIGRTLGMTRYYFRINREPAKYILKFEHPNYETAFANFEMKQISKRRQDIEGPKA